MNYIGKFISNFRDFYNEINAATLTGAIDVLVVEREDGTFACSPFHVRFGKLGVLRAREKVVDIEINGEGVDIHMKLGEAGEAFFVEEVEREEDCPAHLATSPIPSSDFLDQLPSLRQGSLHMDDDVSPTPTVTVAVTSFALDSALVQEAAETEAESLTCEVAVQTEGEDAEDAEVEALCPQGEAEGEARPPRVEEAATPAAAAVAGSVGSHRRQESQKRKKRRSRGGGGGAAAVTGRKRSLQQQHSQPTGRGGEEEAVEEDELFPMEDVEAQDASKVEGKDTSPAQRPGRGAGRGLGRSATLGALERQASGAVASDEEEEEEEEGPQAQQTWPSRRMSHSMGPNFHFFSDTEVSPVCSPLASRPASPVQSDSEYEKQQHSIAIQTEGLMRGVGVGVQGPAPTLQQQAWRWGELPSPATPSPHSQHSLEAKDTARMRSSEHREEFVSSDDEEAMAAVHKEQQAAQQRWILGGMFNFMRRTKRQRAAEGVYLDDLNLEELDPEVTALYFPSSYHPRGKGVQGAEERPGSQHQEVGPAKDEDAESGQGTSLPQSPHGSVDEGVADAGGGGGGPKSLDSDFEDQRQCLLPDMAFSLCGFQHGGAEGWSVKAEAFLENQVSFEQMSRDPHSVLSNPQLVVRLGGRFLPWAAASAALASLAVYQRPLPEDCLRKIMEELPPPPASSSSGPPSTSAEEAKKEEAKQRTSYSWFSWRRSEPKASTTLVATTAVVSATSAAASPLEEVVSTTAAMDVTTSSVSSHPLPMPSPSLHTVPGDEHYAASASSEESDGESGSVRRRGGGPGYSPKKLPLDKRPYYSGSERYRKTLRLSSDQIASLNLREGANEVVFSVTTAYQGTTRCKCHIYYWRYDDKIVVSDIDGTITKSDVLGHILPIIGRDWAQSGVAQLFTKIKNNGYKLLYLSARAIGQARITRDYLRSIKQGDLSLPEGPLLLNPTSLLNAFHREVIEKKPEDFKISCLRDVQALYPFHRNPFYAGYGNKINDVWSYRAVGIPISRIFTINHRGELKHELTQTFQSSYSNLSYIVDHIFPPLGTSEACQPSDDFSQFIYWRDPIPDLSSEEDSSPSSALAAATGTATAFAVANGKASSEADRKEKSSEGSSSSQPVLSSAAPKARQ